MPPSIPLTFPILHRYQKYLANKIYQNCVAILAPLRLRLAYLARVGTLDCHTSLAVVACHRCASLPEGFPLWTPLQARGTSPPSFGRPTGSLPPFGRMNSWGQKAPFSLDSRTNLPLVGAFISRYKRDLGKK